MKFKVSQNLGQTRFDTTTVETEDLHLGEFARNFNSPLTDLNDPAIIQVHPFNSPVIGIPISKLMASA